MAHKRMIVLSDEARKILGMLEDESGMSAAELVEIAIRDLADSGTILSKDKHEKLVEIVRDALGELADDYDTDAIARAIAHGGYAHYAMTGNTRISTDRNGRPWLSVVNLTFDLDEYMT